MAFRRPVFIGGCPRSGTTLVRSMLDAHPDLAIPHETRFLTWGYRTRLRYGDLSQRANRELLARAVIERDLSRHERLTDDPERLVAAMADAPPTVGSVLSAGFRLYAARNGKSRWGDKRPGLLRELDAVFAMSPDGQYVNVVRDPRAAVASIRRVGAAHGWSTDGIVGPTELWERSHRLARRWRRRLGPDQFFEIQYEQLVAEPRATLEKLVAFLGLDPAGIDRMLAFHERTASVRSNRMHPLIAQPLTTQALRSWERELTPTDVAFVQDTLVRQMARYGYEPASGVPEVPAELRAQLRARRMEMRRIVFTRWRMERMVRLKYGHPVEAVPEPDDAPFAVRTATAHRWAV